MPNYGNLEMSVQMFNVDKIKKSAIAKIYANRNKLKAIVRTYAFLILKRAKSRTPVDTGRLRASEHVEFENNDFTAFICSNVEYAPDQEFTTWYKHINGGEWGFFRKSLRDYKEPFKNAIRLALKER